MLGIVINTIVGIVFVTWGILTVNQAPCTEGVLERIRQVVATFVGSDYHIPFYVVGVAFIILGLFALGTAFMMVAAQHGFWLI